VTEEVGPTDRPAGEAAADGPSGDEVPTTRHEPIQATAPPLVPPGNAPPAGPPPTTAGIDAIAPPLVPPSDPPTAGAGSMSYETDPAPVALGTPAIPLVTTRNLLGTSFDLLARSGNDLRRASFYVGAITLGTVGPLVLAALILETEGVFVEASAITGADAGAALVLFILGVLAFAGLMVAVVEGRNLGLMVLGGRMAERPVTTRQALARSRRVFWPTVGAAIVVGLVIGVAQAIAQAILDGLLVEATEVGFIVSTVVAALVGAPFAYALAGVVLGDVGPIEAIRRSFRVYGARRWAAVLIVLFESIAFLLVVLGLEAGLDLVLRVFGTLGLGPTAGAIGFALTVVVAVAVVFAFGTLLFTVYALTVAPQVVMFLGLTHATFGLDLVRPGGRDDPGRPRPGGGTFRWFSVGMIVAFLVAALGLAAVVAYALA
jgi:hypothetical protein